MKTLISIAVLALTLTGCGKKIFGSKDDKKDEAAVSLEDELDSVASEENSSSDQTECTSLYLDSGKDDEDKEDEDKVDNSGPGNAEDRAEKEKEEQNNDMPSGEESSEEAPSGNESESPETSEEEVNNSETGEGENQEEEC